MKKNIALLIPSLMRGGAERTASILSEYFYNLGNNVYIIVDFHNPNTSYNYRGKILKLNKCIYKNQYYSILEKASEVKSYKKKYSIDITVSFMEESNFINILSRYNDKIFITIHTYLSNRLPTWGTKGIIYKFLIMFLYNKADKVISLTHIGKKDLINNFYLNKDKIKIIYNPINLEESLKNNKFYSIDKTKKDIIITVGRLENVKSQWHLIRAFNEVCKKNRNAYLLIVGKGPLLDYLKSLVSQFNIQSRVYFLGLQKDIYRFLSLSKVFVLSSQTEGLPNSILEAMACGLPIISTDCISGPREILAPNTKYYNLSKIEYCKYGVLTPKIDGKKYHCKTKLTYSEKMLSQAILNMLSDKAMYNRYCKLSKIRVKKFDINKVGAKWVNLFE